MPSIVGGSSYLSECNKIIPTGTTAGLSPLTINSNQNSWSTDGILEVHELRKRQMSQTGQMSNSTGEGGDGGMGE